MKDRLAQFLKSEGLTAVKFAEIMEVQPSSISHLLSGRNKPNFEFISRMLLRFPELNPDWIINGNDGIYRSKDHAMGDVVTDVMRTGITDVIDDQSGGDRDLFTSNPKQRNEDKAKNNMPLGTVEGLVTDVNTALLAKDEPEPSVSENHVTKSIERVILFYTDGSFEEYHNA